MLMRSPKDRHLAIADGVIASSNYCIRNSPCLGVFIGEGRQTGERSVWPARLKISGEIGVSEDVNSCGDDLWRATMVDRQFDDFDTRESIGDMDEYVWIAAIETINRLGRITNDVEVIGVWRS